MVFILIKKPVSFDRRPTDVTNCTHICYKVLLDHSINIFSRSKSWLSTNIRHYTSLWITQRSIEQSAIVEETNFCKTSKTGGKSRLIDFTNVLRYCVLGRAEHRCDHGWEWWCIWKRWFMDEGTRFRGLECFTGICEEQAIDWKGQRKGCFFKRNFEHCEVCRYVSMYLLLYNKHRLIWRLHRSRSLANSRRFPVT